MNFLSPQDKVPKASNSWAIQFPKPGLSLSKNVPWHGTQQCWGTPMVKPSHSHIRPSIQKQRTSRNILDSMWNETGKAHPSWGGHWGPTDRICHHSWSQHHKFIGEESLAESPNSDRLVSVSEAENLIHSDWKCSAYLYLSITSEGWVTCTDQPWAAEEVAVDEAPLLSSRDVPQPSAWLSHTFPFYCRLSIQGNSLCKQIWRWQKEIIFDTFPGGALIMKKKLNSGNTWLAFLLSFYHFN